MARRAKNKSTSLAARPLGGSGGEQVATRRRRTAVDLAPLTPKDCPDYLDGAAQQRWRELAKELSRVNLIARVDGDALALYCSTWSRWVAAVAKVQELGLVVTSPAGIPMQNPFLGVASAAAAQLVTLAKQLGLTPAARGELRRRA